MPLKLISRKLKKFGNLIIQNCYVGERTHPDSTLTTTVTGSYIGAIWNNDRNSKFYWMGNYKYILLVSDSHFYEFYSKIDFGD